MELNGEIVVQKYGGTSVGSVERIQKVAQRVVAHAKAGQRVAVVVSAMAGETNRLVSLINNVNPKSSAKSYDIAVAAGEQVSIGLVSAAIEGCGMQAEPLLGYQLGIQTDGDHAKARIQNIETEKIETCWKEGRIPVIAGFQGVNKDMAVTTLGRGGSDTSAVALAVALKADVCEINTDVEGVFTADPRIVPTAQLIKVLDYDTALELAALGGKVLHSRCVELGAKYHMPIIVRSSFDTDNLRRTNIMAFGEKEALEAPVVSAISLDEDVARVSVTGIKKTTSSISQLFKAIADAGINVDIIIHNSHVDRAVFNVGFTVVKSDLEKSVAVIKSLETQDAFKETKVKTATDLAKVSAVGLGMKSHSGVACRVFEALANANIHVQMVSTSEIKISTVVPLADSKRAVQVLHSSFFDKA